MGEIIHQFWDKGTLPEKYHTWVDSWKRTFPSWEYKLWSDESAKELFEKYNFTVKYDIQRWDLLKLILVYEYGGIYADVDCECIGTPLFDERTYFVCEKLNMYSSYYIHPFFFYSTKSSPVLKFILKHIPKYLNGTRFAEPHTPDRETLVKNSTGPAAITALFCQYSRPSNAILDGLPTFLLHHNTKSWIRNILINTKY